MQDPQSHHRAPPGAACAEHPERSATFTCPRCGNYSCLFCWHPVAERCDTCLKRDPAAAAPQLPWETQQGSPLVRYLRTLASSFRPMLMAPAFARPGLRRAWTFFLLSALPAAALAGIIPRTKTLMFGNFAVVVQGNPTATEIALDVLRAMALQLGACTVELIAFGLPYLSLVQAYTPSERHHAATRALLYRSWLSPFAAVVFYTTLWLTPSNEAFASLVYNLTSVLMHLMFLSSLRATARLACGIGPLMSYVIVLVSLAVYVLGQLFWNLLPSL